MADFEEAIKRGKFVATEIQGIKRYDASIYIENTTDNGIRWPIVNFDKYPTDPTLENSLIIYGKTIKDGVIDPRIENDRVDVYWKKK